MQFAIVVAATAWVSSLLVASSVGAPSAPALERIVSNDNRSSAGVLRNGVLTVHLEAREGEWHPDQESAPGLVVRAFAEKGKRLLVPGPLIRVPEGTEIHAFVTKSFALGTLVVRGLSPRGIASVGGADTVQIPPGATREVRFVAGVSGTYYYRGTIDGAPTGDRSTSTRSCTARSSWTRSARRFGRVIACSSSRSGAGSRGRYRPGPGLRYCDSRSTGRRGRTPSV